MGRARERNEPGVEGFASLEAPLPEIMAAFDSLPKAIREFLNNCIVSVTPITLGPVVEKFGEETVLKHLREQEEVARRALRAADERALRKARAKGLWGKEGRP